MIKMVTGSYSFYQNTLLASISNYKLHRWHKQVSEFRIRPESTRFCLNTKGQARLLILISIIERLL
jgi:hypothetical protein